MEFIKVGKNYMIKNSNGRIVSEKEKLELENKELALKDITGCGCQQETTKKISKNKKRIKEIDEKAKEIYKKEIQEYTDNLLNLTTAQKKVDGADDIIEETDTTI